MCDYPSECRWGKKFGIHTPVETVFPSAGVNSMPTLNAPVNTIPRGILKPENCTNIRTSRQTEKTTFWGALLASVERRKSASERGASPLSTVAEKNEAQGHVDDTSENRDSDGDIVMETIDPALLDEPSNSPLAASPDSLKALVSRRRYRRVKARSNHTARLTRIILGRNLWYQNLWQWRWTTRSV